MKKISFYDFDDTIGVQDYSYLFATMSMEKSLERSKPLPMLGKMLAQHENGDDVYVLTARVFSESAQNGIKAFLDRNGIDIPKERIYMVGEAGKAKSDIISQFLKYERPIEFHDDLAENIRAVNSLNSKLIRTFWVTNAI